MMENKIHLSAHWGMFWGSFSQNQFHQHYALQVSLAGQDALTIETEDGAAQAQERYLIKSNVRHRLTCSGPHCLILINPGSALGHFLGQQATAGVGAARQPAFLRVQEAFRKHLAGALDHVKFVEQVSTQLQGLECQCQDALHGQDDRIHRAMAYLEAHTDRVIPLPEVADVCALSPSRFLHLFKEKTGLTYRRAQLWTRIRLSFAYLGQQSITETAHQFGFTDSAHYTRTFKQNFGFSPKVFSKL